MLCCSMCDGPLMLLGVLGSLAHFRCQNCGWQESKPASEVEEDNTDTEEEEE